MQRGTGTLVLYLFDLLELDGEPLLDLPFDGAPRAAAGARRRPARRAVRLSEVFEDGQALVRGGGRAGARRDRGEAGVVARTSRVSGREDWVKVKVHRRQEFVIAGYTRGAGRRAGTLGALVLGVWDGGELVWAGNCGTGFSDADIDDLLSKLRPLERRRSPFTTVPKMPRVRKRGRRLGEARARLRGRVRRVDARGTAARAVVPGPARRQAPGRGAPGARRSRRRSCDGSRKLRVRNLDKVFWPGEGITKGDLLDYYRRVAPVLVPHLRDRPFTMKRYPDGIEGGHFFQKDAPVAHAVLDPTRPFPASSRDGKRTRTIRYPLVNDELALALDGEHGLHRHERVALPRRQARAARRGPLRSRPVGRRARTT